MIKYLSEKNGIIYADAGEQWPHWKQEFMTLIPIDPAIRCPKAELVNFENTRTITKEVIVETPEVLDEEGNVVTPAESHVEQVEEIEVFQDSKYIAVEDEVAVKALQETELYNQMNADVYAQMSAVFETTNPDSASAFHGTWQLMLAKPQLFAVDCGFNSEQEVVAYANMKLAQSDAYAVYRIKRIKQFKEDRVAL